MQNPFTERWSSYFLDVADRTALQSKDPSTKCGAVIVNDKRRIIATGFNGFPESIEDRQEWLDDREVKYSLVTHAEVNAVLNAVADVNGAHLFITGPSCPECTKFIIAAGIKTVHWRMGQTDFLERWKDRLKISADIYEKANITPFVY